MSSFLSGFMGNKAADSFVDQAVDKAAAVAKKKVKEKFGVKTKDPAGGMGGLFPSAGEKQPKQKEGGGGGGFFGGLLKSEPPEEPMPTFNENASGGVASGGDFNLNDELGDIANELASDAAKQ